MLMTVNVGVGDWGGRYDQVILFHDYVIYHDIALNKCIMVSKMFIPLKCHSQFFISQKNP